MPMKIPTLFIVVAIALSPLALSGCASLIIGGAATAGMAAYDERGIKGVALDTATSTHVRAKLLEADSNLFAEVGVEVYEGRVLLTGRVPSEEKRAEAVRIAWSVEDVTDVINEVAVRDNPLSDMANDSWITAQLKTKLTLDKNIYAVNYAIETVGGTIYLIGIAQDQAELDRTLDHARSISYVRRVVNHVRIKSPQPS